MVFIVFSIRYQKHSLNFSEIVGWMSPVTGNINKHNFWYENKIAISKETPKKFLRKWKNTERNFAWPKIMDFYLCYKYKSLFYLPVQQTIAAFSHLPPCYFQVPSLLLGHRKAQAHPQDWGDLSFSSLVVIPLRKASTYIHKNIFTVSTVRLPRETA